VNQISHVRSFLGRYPLLLLALAVPHPASSQPLAFGTPEAPFEAGQRLSLAVGDTLLSPRQRDVMPQLARGGGASTLDPKAARARPARANSSSSITQEAPEQQQKAFSFLPGDHGRCRTFLITETSAGQIFQKTHDNFDKYIFANHLGLMVNLNPHSSVGATIDLNFAEGYIHDSYSGRYRYWFNENQSAEFSISHFPNNREGLVGQMYNLRYSPGDYFYVQGGYCELREWYSTVLDEYYVVEGARAHFEPYAGIGVSGPPGAAFWLVEGVGFGILAAIGGMFEGY
jgi:hypothetical protein